MKKYCQKLLSFILSVGVCISLAGPVCAETAQPPVSEGVGIVESVPTSVCSEEDIAETVADSIEPENAASSEGAVSIESQIENGVLKVWYGAKKQEDSSWHIGLTERNFEEFLGILS